MEATFFTASYEEAIGVRSVDELPSDPESEPLAISRLGILRELAGALGSDPATAFQQVTDTTCQSFPVWAFARDFTDALQSVSETKIDDVANAWRARVGPDAFDADLHELSTLVADLQQSLANLRDSSQRLFVLLEEKAF